MVAQTPLSRHAAIQSKRTPLERELERCQTTLLAACRIAVGGQLVIRLDAFGSFRPGPLAVCVWHDDAECPVALLVTG